MKYDELKKDGTQYRIKGGWYPDLYTVSEDGTLYDQNENFFDAEEPDELEYEEVEIVVKKS